MVVRAGTAVGTHVTIRVITGIALVGVDLEVAFGDGQVGLGDDLVQGEFSTAHDLARSAVTEDMGFLWDFGRPCDLAAVAFSFIWCHGG